MELCRRDVILAAVVAFIAWGYITHWVPTLRFVPQAFLAGAATTVLGLLWLLLTTSRGRQNGTISTASVKRRNVAFIAPEAWKVETDWLKSTPSYRKEPLYLNSAIVSDSIDTLLDLVLRDFVGSWYQSISKRATFTNEVDRSIRAALGNIKDRVLRVDLVDVVISRVVPIITTHMHDFDEAERTVRGRKLTRNVTESDELDLAIAGKYRDGKLHPAAALTFSNTNLVQQQHLRSIVMRLLPKVLPASMISSPAVTVLIKELVSCAVLFPIMQTLADPDTWNQLLEAYGRTLLQDRKTVRKLRAALDAHAPASPRPAKTVVFPNLSPKDNERQFERYVYAIKKCNAISDARRFRSEVASQLRKERAVEGQDALYLRRLETAKRMLDQKIADLGVGASGAPKRPIKIPHQPIRTGSRFENASLREVLYDTSGLSYFMEYMDRLNLMRLVQFWIVVDGFRNPLEAGTDEPQEFIAGSSWTESDRADIAQINEAYLTKPEIKVPTASRDTIKQFLKAGASASPAQYLAARRAVLQAQTAAYEEIQDPHFRNFKKSDLYFKWLASDETATAGVQAGLKKSTTTRPHTDKRSLFARPPAISPAQTAETASRPSAIRRAGASSSDLQSLTKATESGSLVRRSLDESRRAPLFDDDYDTDAMAGSTQTLDSSMNTVQVTVNDPNIVDAMQAALDDIMEDEPDKDSLLSEQSLMSPQDQESERSSFEVPRPASPARKKEKPSIASLGLVGTPSRQSVFSDALFGDEEEFVEDEREDSDVNDKSEDEIHEAAPGDLGLAEAIDGLTADIEKLVIQESIVDTLTKKAELTNNAAELRILRKSKASLQREIHRKELQRQQYIVQESDNSLYGRATVSIKSIMVGREQDGREFAMYVIEVQRQAGDQMPAAAWVVARRYSEFHELNKRLRARYPVVRSLEFPRRQVVFKLQKDFLKKRRLALERYLRELLLVPAICRSRELRAFLSQQAISPVSPTNPQLDTRDFVTRIYNSVTDGMEEFLGNIPVLDQLSVAGQNLISAATTQLNITVPNGTAPTNTADDAATAAETEAELRAFDNRELEPFVKPICDLFLEVFELNRESNWLRGRAVVVVLHQLLGGTIERKVRENAKTYLQADSVARYINLMRDMIWPGGKMRQPAPPRTAAEKARSRKEAGLLLAALIPDLAGSVVGRANAQAASRRILATLNNERLNTHLALTLLDEVVQVLFGDGVAR